MLSFMGGVPTVPSAATSTLNTCVLRSMRGTAKRVGLMGMVELRQPSACWRSSSSWGSSTSCRGCGAGAGDGAARGRRRAAGGRGLGAMCRWHGLGRQLVRSSQLTPRKDGEDQHQQGRDGRRGLSWGVHWSHGNNRP